MLDWRDTIPLIESSPDILLRAMDLAADHQLFLLDALVLAAAGDGRCRILLSEDLQDGFTWGGATVVNPFTAPMHPLLAQALKN